MSMPELRRQFHESLCKAPLLEKSAKKDHDLLNIDGEISIRKRIELGILERICNKPHYNMTSKISVNLIFIKYIEAFLKESLGLREKFPKDTWKLHSGSDISQFEQFRYIDSAKKEIDKQALHSSNFYILPDIIVSRSPVYNELGPIDEQQMPISARSANKFSCGREKIIHACISCFWSLQGKTDLHRMKIFNLIRNRKGHIPHIVAVTGEPTLTRIASLALGTGDIDCVYHFALHELKDTLDEIQDESQLDMYAMLVDGKRLRDISDLPFDLAV